MLYERVSRRVRNLINNKDVSDTDTLLYHIFVHDVCSEMLKQYRKDAISALKNSLGNFSIYNGERFTLTRKEEKPRMVIDSEKLRALVGSLGGEHRVDSLLLQCKKPSKAPEKYEVFELS